MGIIQSEPTRQTAVSLQALGKLFARRPNGLLQLWKKAILCLKSLKKTKDDSYMSTHEILEYYTVV